MILSDRDIREAMQSGPKWTTELGFIEMQVYVDRDPLVIDPMPADDCFQPASVDLTLANHMVDLAGNSWMVYDGDLHMHPGQFLIASTREKVTIPDWLVGVVDGKSTLGRKGLAVHITAGYIDPGFSGQITLELRNLGTYPVLLSCGMKICQLRLTRLTSPVLRPYGHPDLNSHYQGQMGPTSARVD